MLPITLELPEGFLNEQIRCDYTISSQMKEVWAVELDLLCQFIKVCEKYNLKYFAMSGTLLGAVRHKGFIPWDDDIDLIMPRDDYDKLLQIGPNEFKHPYFFSTPDTEYKFWRSHIQIRNSETTGTIKDDVLRNNNKGIFIDIFVLDEVSEELSERNRQRKQLKKIPKTVSRAMNLKLIKNNSKQSLKGLLKYTLISLYSKLFVSEKTYHKTFKKFNEVCAMFNNINSSLVATTSLSYPENGVWKKEDFEETVEVPFEMIKIAIPKGAARILETEYGSDYMEIPKEIPKTCHGQVFFDAHKPYKHYYK